MKLEQNHASALLYVSIKQSSLKILRHLALFFRDLKFWCETGMRSPNPEWLLSKFVIKKIIWIKSSDS